MTSLGNLLGRFALDAKDLEDGELLDEVGMHDRAAIVCALVSYWPDRDASETEIGAALTSLNTLSAGKVPQIWMKARILEIVDYLQREGELGHAMLLKTLRDKPKDFKESRLLVRIGILVANADGEAGQDPFSPAEKTEVAAIATALGLDPSIFGL